MTRAMQEILDKIGVPIQLYSDQEGSFNSVECIRLINKHNITHIMVVDKAHTVEHFNRTLKENIYRRLTAMGLDTDRWTSQLEAVVNKCNSTEHSTIKLTPHQVRKDEHQLTVSFNIWSKSKQERVYPELKVGDDVRVMLTKDSKAKGYKPTWSTDTYKVTFIKHHYYLVDNLTINKYLRH